MGEEEEKTRAKREKLDIFVMEFCTFFLLSVRSAEGRTAQMLNNLSDYLCFHVFHYFGEVSRSTTMTQDLFSYPFWGKFQFAMFHLEIFIFLVSFFLFFPWKKVSSRNFHLISENSPGKLPSIRDRFAAFRSAEISTFFRFSLYPPRKNYGRSILLLRFHRFRIASFLTAKSTQLTINPHGSALTLFH